MGGRSRIILAFVSGLLSVGLVLSTVTTAMASRKDRSYFEREGTIVWEVPTDQKVIALTFDDGPSSKFTVQILDLLKEYHAKATFFVVGERAVHAPDVIKRQVAEHHEVANHTFSHIIGRLSEEKLSDEMNRTQDVLRSITGETPKLFRPPGGIYNETIANTAKRLGCLVIMWSWDLDTRDWSSPGVQKMVQKVLSNTHNGDIILFHDYGMHCPQTIKTLQEILPVLQQRGYQFITVSELLKYRHKSMEKNQAYEQPFAPIT